MIGESEKQIIKMNLDSPPAEIDYSPEHELLAQIIRRAVWDAFGAFKEGKSLRQQKRKRQAMEAQEWLLSELQTPFTFRWICCHLNIDPDGFIQKLNMHIAKNSVVKELQSPTRFTEATWSRLRTVLIELEFGAFEREE